jgi:hypothetical protein
MGLRWLGLVGCLGALGLAGCGGTTTTTDTVTAAAQVQTSTSTTTVTKTVTQSAATHSTSAPPQTSAGSETVHDANGNALSVGRPSDYDPAQGANQAYTPDAGKRFVAVDFNLHNGSGSTISDDADSDTTVVGTDTQVYTADFSQVSECTNFNNGQYSLTPGESESGCVVFQLPTGVGIKRIAFTIGFEGDVAQWAGPAG